MYQVQISGPGFLVRDEVKRGEDTDSAVKEWGLLGLALSGALLMGSRAICRTNLVLASTVVHVLEDQEPTAIEAVALAESQFYDAAHNLIGAWKANDETLCRSDR